MRAGPPVARSWDTTTVLGVKGALRRAKSRRALDPLRAVVGVWGSATGGSGGITRRGTSGRPSADQAGKNQFVENNVYTKNLTLPPLAHPHHTKIYPITP
jgi:hypothetical protein